MKKFHQKSLGLGLGLGSGRVVVVAVISGVRNHFCGQIRIIPSAPPRVRARSLRGAVPRREYICMLKQKWALPAAAKLFSVHRKIATHTFRVFRRRLCSCLYVSRASRISIQASLASWLAGYIGSDLILSMAGQETPDDRQIDDGVVLDLLLLSSDAIVMSSRPPRVKRG